MIDLPDVMYYNNPEQTTLRPGRVLSEQMVQHFVIT